MARGAFLSTQTLMCHWCFILRCNIREYVQDLKTVFYQAGIPRGEVREFGSDLLLPASPQQESIVPSPPSSNEADVSCTFLFPVVCGLHSWSWGSHWMQPLVLLVCFWLATPKSELSLEIWWWQSLQAGQGPSNWREVLLSVFSCCRVAEETSLKWNMVEVCSKELDETSFSPVLWQVVCFWHCTALTVQAALAQGVSYFFMGWSLCPSAAWSVRGSVPRSSLCLWKGN